MVKSKFELLQKNLSEKGYIVNAFGTSL